MILMIILPMYIPWAERVSNYNNSSHLNSAIVVLKLIWTLRYHHSNSETHNTNIAAILTIPSLITLLC